ncbi:MAG: hypothetical protein ACM34K_18320 [Bacillota bacterium]
MMFNKEDDIRNDFRRLNKEGMKDQEIYPILAEEYILSESTIKKICKSIKTRFCRCKYEGCNKQYEISKAKISPLFWDYCAEHREKVSKPWKSKEKTKIVFRKNKEKEKPKFVYDLRKCHKNCGEEFEYDRDSVICRNCSVIMKKKVKTMKEHKVIGFTRINHKAVKVAFYAGIEI